MNYKMFTFPDPYYAGNLRLNAGCGNDFWGDIRIDVDPDAEAKTHEMDLCRIDFPSNLFIETRCISVLEHISDWKGAVQELTRVTKGILIIEVPVNSNLLLTDLLRILIPTPKNIKLFLSRKERAKETFHQFDPEEIKKELEKNGFKTEFRKVYQIYHSYPSRCWRFICMKIEQGIPFRCLVCKNDRDSEDCVGCPFISWSK